MLDPSAQLHVYINLEVNVQVFLCTSNTMSIFSRRTVVFGFLFGVIEQTLIRRCRRDKMCTTEVSARHNLFDTATEENKYTCLNLCVCVCVCVPVQKDHLHESSLMRKCDTLYWWVCTWHFPPFSGRNEVHCFKRTWCRYNKGLY